MGGAKNFSGRYWWQEMPSDWFCVGTVTVQQTGGKRTIQEVKLTIDFWNHHEASPSRVYHYAFPHQSLNPNYATALSVHRLFAPASVMEVCVDHELRRGGVRRNDVAWGVTTSGGA
jgi:hypothetical protein